MLAVRRLKRAAQAGDVKAIDREIHRWNLELRRRRAFNRRRGIRRNPSRPIKGLSAAAKRALLRA
jgi:hypothetical protein